jgi:hypothetical protein
VNVEVKKAAVQKLFLLVVESETLDLDGVTGREQKENVSIFADHGRSSVDVKDCFGASQA